MLRVLLFIGLLSYFPSTWAQESAPKAKYHRAMIFHGGGFQTGVFLGMLAGAEDAGAPPDVIVGTCGGSVAAAIVKSFSTDQERIGFLESREYYDFLRAIQFNPKYRGRFGILRLLERIYEAKKTHKIADVYNDYLLEIPAFPAFPARSANIESSPKIVIVGSKLLFSKEDVGQPMDGRKLYEEVFFTDSATGDLLQNFISPISRLKGNRVLDETKVVTDFSLFDAVRGSIADPFEMTPIRINGDEYLTGAIDLYPIEVANALAEETIMPYAVGFDSFVAGPVISASFGFRNNDRLRDVTSQYARYWVDQSDFESFFKKDSLFPTFNMGEPKSGIPDNYEDYVKRIERQWRVGFDRTRESILLNHENDKNHIRVKDSRNSQDASKLLTLLK